MIFIRIAVISDTHIPRKGKVLPPQLTDGLRGADLIIHAGDINRDYVIYELEEYAPVVAVAGNTDDDYMHGKLGTKRILEVSGCRIGVIHGDGTSLTTLERAVRAFSGENTDCVVFGHSHIPFNEVREGVLYFNPGSPTDKRRQERYSYGMLTVEEGVVKGQIIHFL